MSGNDQQRNSRDRGMTPLWVISLFVSLSEVVTGIAVTQATGGIQVALTAFVVVFPILVATAFFAILWARPWVFYSPTEFGTQTDVTQYVDAMRRRDETDAKMMDVIQSALDDAFTSPQAVAKLEGLLKNGNNLSDQKIAAVLKDVGKTALSTVEKSVLTIDPTLIAGERAPVRQIPYNPMQPVGRFLDDIWFSLDGKIPSYRYDDLWIVRDVKSGFELRNAGRSWARKHGKNEDQRTVSEVGIKPGMHLQATPISR